MANNNIKFTTINVENIKVSREFKSVAEMKKDWNSDNCTLPMLDDELVSAEVGGKEFKGNTFADLVSFIELDKIPA